MKKKPREKCDDPTPCAECVDGIDCPKQKVVPVKVDKTFKVSVEKRMYATGILVIGAADADAAIKAVRKQIDKGEIQTTSVVWDDPQYEDSSFDATGDVEEV